MNGLLNVYKQRSETPLQTVRTLRRTLGISEDVKIGYAGRLDPLADGVILLMIGDECKKRSLFQAHDKRYRFKILFGISTDSLDSLGRVKKREYNYTLDEGLLNETLTKISGEIEIRYPLYSSYAIDGIAMHKLARKELITDADRPSKTVIINKAELISIEEYKLSALVDKFINDIRKVEGQFDQENVINVWKDLSTVSIPLKVAQIEVDVSSGTYIRSLAELIGDRLSIPTIAYDIERMSVGNFSINDSLRV